MNLLARICAVMTAVVFCVACSGVSPSSLRIPAALTVLTLPQEFTYNVDYKLSNASVRFSIAAGSYSALREDDEGTYYQGPPKCFSTMVTAPGWAYQEDFVGKILRYNCGIFLPNDRLKPAKLYLTAAQAEAALGINVPPAPTNTAATDAPVIITEIVLRTAPNASPLQAGVGASLGVGIATAMAETEMRNIQFWTDQPNGADLRAALIKR